MANLSQDDRTVIGEHPLDDFLDHLRDLLRKAEQSYGPSSTSHNGAGDTRDQEPSKAVSRLLSILQGHDVAFTLRSKTGAGVLAAELSTLFRRVRNGDFNYQQYRTLSLLVINLASDFDIWNAVFDLIRSISRINPPTSIPLQLPCSLACHVDFLHVITEFLELFREIIPHYGHGVDRFFQPRPIIRTSFGLESRTDCQSGRVARPKEHV